MPRLSSSLLMARELPLMISYIVYGRIVHPTLALNLSILRIGNALIGVLNSGFKASEARNYIENLRIAQAENFPEEQKKAADNAAFAEELSRLPG